ncbi:tRNA (adenosine(37)-N6)-threonylcarbamoyltransferase complex ATPase subunit type 1 TsaE [Prochlorococcus sp. MIT 1300]|uniref:tRNA (adenosine(37)-N6)-threonylcarbamoyltransferase complex ATPase subunit type 1 TsaE n=1 Tax=Prochlorococcus sp. MIT 1300 TaxID=3096218 RepID=UPI002A76547F|nr:tRNA (adenosine(37)-N6)-threonylcarbamoyltransferase complex ATPase subunit type 1 TsaE [Prochlorococcus sp. MIT 1300]
MRQSTDEQWILKNLDETVALGKSLANKLPDCSILLLEGPLGAGKTSLVKGLALGLGIDEAITSPTFPLAQHYPMGQPPLIHIDLYRLTERQSADELFLQEEEEAITIAALIAVEWPERLGIALPDAWKLKLKYLNRTERLAQLIKPSKLDKKTSTSCLEG